MTDAASNNDLIRRREAGAFLRSRRGRLLPSNVGLSQGFGRRTPGLRREEVAILAGVGTTWYTWLEQGREIRPSSEVLFSLAKVLQLDASERHHLFSMYDRVTPKEQRVPDGDLIGEPLQRMVDGMGGQPAIVLGWRWDILGWNRAAEVVIGPQEGLQGSAPNVLDFLFTNPTYRRLFVDWENVARGALATFRADCALHIGDPDFERMVARLASLSPEFAAWWPQRNVAHRLSGKKCLNHPIVGHLHFTFSMLAVGNRPGMKLFVFTAADEEDTSRKLGQLLNQPNFVA